MERTCIYCPEAPKSLEHPLPAAFGEFRAAPRLENYLCKRCNNRLGVLDEQLTRCGPEALFRKFYGIEGRSTHNSVNIFERGSAGGHRVDLRAKDEALGIDVLLEIENGKVRQMRQIVFVETSGKTHHLPIRAGSTPEQLRAAYEDLGVVQPCDQVSIFSDPEERDWVERLIAEAWPSARLGEQNLGSTSYQGAVGTVVLTERYFRAVAKIGFHYFLTQFRQYSGHEQMFADIRKFILQDGGGIDRANEFVGKREHALLNEMLAPKVRPNGWRAHVLCAEIRPGECLAYVQTFVTEDWAAPIYAVYVARDATLVDCQTVGHAYMYYGDGPECNFAGDWQCQRNSAPPCQRMLAPPVAAFSRRNNKTVGAV
jgi:hypothetical protein